MEKTSFCSVVFLGFTAQVKGLASALINEKTLFNVIVEDAIKEINESDRFIIDTSDGMAISLVGKVESGMLIAIKIRDAIVAHNKTAETPLYVGLGVNFCPTLANGVPPQLAEISDAISNAQHIMYLAHDGQILATNSYRDAVVNHAKRYANQFTCVSEANESELSQDKSAVVYQIGLAKRSKVIVADYAKKSQPKNIEKLAAIEALALTSDTDADDDFFVTNNQHIEYADLPSMPAPGLPPQTKKHYYLWAILSALCLFSALMLFSQKEKVSINKYTLALTKTLEKRSENNAQSTATEPTHESLQLQPAEGLEKLNVEKSD